MPGLSVTVGAPPGAVFDYLSDPSRRPEWQSSLRSVELLDDGPPRLHTRWIDRTAVGARPRMQIVEMRRPGTEPGVWREVGRWRGLRAELTLTFAAGGTGTVVAGTFRIDGWLPVRLVLQALARPAIASDLRRAARILERQ